MIMEKEKLVSLVSKAQNGDKTALNELFNAFYNDIYYFALKTVKDENLAYDITQEAFVEIINTLSNLKEPAAFVTWSKQITYHQCTRYFKKKKDVLVDEDEEGASIFDTVREENAEFIPDEALDNSDFKTTILNILNELSEEQRSATMMYYFDEMSVREIAEVQGVSEGTVKSRLNYARKTIKASVEDYEKKNNIKLHALPFFPFIKWIFGAETMPLASASALAEGITAATGTAVSVSATGVATAVVASGATTGVASASVAAGAAVSTTATSAATAATVGLGAKILALPLVTKVIAGVVAAVVVAGTSTAVVLSNIGENNTNTNNDTSSSQTVNNSVGTESFVLEGTIPNGCTYTLYDGTVLKAGDKFPEECTTGDKVQYKDYYYGYECYYAVGVDGAEKEWYMWDELFDSGDGGVDQDDVYGGWTPSVLDRSKESYGSICSMINGKPIKNMFATFFNCVNMVSAPSIPETVASISMTYTNCTSLEKAPIIPQNVKRLTGAFRKCTSLKGTVYINSQLDKSTFWYYYGVFDETTNAINLKGQTPDEDLWLIAEECNNYNLLVNGVSRQKYYNTGRLQEADLTTNDILNNLKYFYENNMVGVFYEREDGTHCSYSADAVPAQIADFDIFGYGINIDEMLGDGWGSAGFGYTTDANNKIVSFDGLSVSYSIPLKSADELEYILNRDLEVIESFLNEKGDPYYNFNDNEKDGRGLDFGSEIINKMLEGGKGLHIFTTQKINGVGYWFGISCQVEDGVYYYYINYNVTPTVDAMTK